MLLFNGFYLFTVTGTHIDTFYYTFSDKFNKHAANAGSSNSKVYDDDQTNILCESDDEPELPLAVSCLSGARAGAGVGFTGAGVGPTDGASVGG
jgi:hypothetical protein